ncbi:MAG: M28 family metallopeptidase [Phycisphaeraceae bacterium]|nr:M28 family metallopeptidase [Phycisphaeraceae bacterium]
MLIPTLAISAVVSMVPPPPAPFPRQVMGGIDAVQIRADLDALVGFGTRHTMSDTASATRGIGAARAWLKAQFDELGKQDGSRDLQVSYETFTQPAGRSDRVPADTEIYNVVAVLPGAMKEAEGRRYYIVGHYDSRNGDGLDATGDAPGANDDASGVVAMLNVARTLAPMQRPDATIVFLATAGEEQGLLGAKFHAEQAAARGEHILGVLNNDIVGDPSAPAGTAATANARRLVRVFSEGLPREASAEEYAKMRALSAESDSPSRQLARYIYDVAQTYNTSVKPKLVFRADRFLRGGDHLAFNEAGFPAVRFTELDEDYSRQHQNVTEKDGAPYGDMASFVDTDYLADVCRLNAAAIVCLANAPSPPGDAVILTGELTSTTTLRWTKPPEPDVAGYEVVWRETTSPVWQQSQDVGDVTQATIRLNKDDYFFGIRAYDRDGYRSPVAFPHIARE